MGMVPEEKHNKQEMKSEESDFVFESFDESRGQTDSMALN